MGPVLKFPEKLRIATHLQKAVGLGEKTANPVHYRLLWKCGLNVPPPVLAPAWVTFAVHVAPINLVLLSLMAAGGLLTKDGGVAWLVVASTLLAASALAGIITFVMWYERRKHEFPTWLELDDLLRAGKLQKLLRDGLA